MSNFIPIETEGGQFYIEVLPTEGQTGIKQRSRDNITEKLTKDDFKQMIRQAVMPACQTFIDVWQELNQPLTAESAEVEFNLGFTASGSAVIVQASGQTSFKVKVNWKFKDEGVLISAIRRALDQAGVGENTTSLELYRALVNWEDTSAGKLESIKPVQMKRSEFEPFFEAVINHRVMKVGIPDPPGTVQIPPQEREKLKTMLEWIEPSI